MILNQILLSTSQVNLWKLEGRITHQILGVNVFTVLHFLKLGYKHGDPLKVEDVNKFDQMHYYGSKAVNEAIDMLGIR